MLFSFFTCFISEGVSGGEAPLSFGTFRHAVFAKGEKGQKVVSAGGSFCRAVGRAALLGFFPVVQQNRAAVLRVGEQVWFRTNQKNSESQKEYLIIS